ncbi:serine hydrolase [Gemmatirosa kalamazoonensis]|uniref:serine hydrolase n=1 Tax=Gemmatirosa kalamazoonensis TaxID=861299 RepID=UPI00191C34DA|nr:serine hydrolase [Gemmatirosa kalamazoonensis]
MTSVTPRAGAAEPIDSLRARVERRVAELRGTAPDAFVAVAWRDLGTGERLDLHGDSVFHAASTMKVPVMIELMRRSDRGALALDQEILLVNRFASIVDGSPYALDTGDDSDSATYALVGRRVAVRELIRRMIVRSSNLATNALIALADPAQVTATAASLGAVRTRVRRGVEDQKAFDKGLNNVTTASDLAALLEAIERGRAASAGACAEMRRVLLGQELDAGSIPAGVPPGTRVAHKSGQITGVLHDAAIVYPRGRPPYVLVVLTRGIPDEKLAAAAIADVSRLVYAYAAPNEATTSRR